MRKLAIIQLIIIFITLFIISITHAQDKEMHTVYMDLTEYWKRNSVDRDKNWVNDSNRCWAYAIANALSFSVGADTDTVLAELRELYPRNEGESPLLALIKLFELNEISIPNIVANIHASDDVDVPILFEWIVGAMAMQKCVIILGLTNAKNTDEGHAVTAYSVGIYRNTQYILYADSDDRETGLRTMMLHKKDNKYFQLGTTWFIDIAISLQVKP